MARSVPVGPRSSNRRAGGGGCAVVGASTTSTELKIWPTRRWSAGSLRRAQRNIDPDSSSPIRMLASVRRSNVTSSPSRSAQSSNPAVERGRKLIDSRSP